MSANDTTSGELRLGFGFDQYAGLALAGFFGMIPLVAWLEALSPGGPTFGLASRLWAAAVILGCPAFPCLVLWLRQPRAAHITWGERSIAVFSRGRETARIAWESASVRTSGGLGTPPLAFGRRKKTWRAIQVVDVASGAAITVVEGWADEAQRARRRLRARWIEPLAAAIRARGIPPDGGVDWALAGDRPEARAARWCWLGYVLVVAGLSLRAEPGAMTAITILGATLLIIRASIPARELAATRRAAAILAPPAAAAGAYRAAARPPDPATATSPVSRAAIGLELAVRLSFAALSVASLVVSLGS